jgi:SAM-dependent methyltransferase
MDTPLPLMPHAPADAAPSRLDAFLADVQRAIDTLSFGSLVLSKNRDAAAGLKSVRLRLIALRGAPALSFAYMHATRDETKNLALGEGLVALATFLDPHATPSFAHATLHATGADVQLMVSKKGRQTLRRLARQGEGADAAGATALPAHDRARERRLPLDLPFWVELGITDASHRIVPAMARKWRQIDKFLEVLDHALDALPVPPETPGTRAPVPIRVVDFGCGKGYLTFAVHEHLRRRFGVAPQVTGVELRAELVDFCNGVAERCACNGLRFVQGDLRSVEPEAVDVMIALHACDTATDHAIDLGLRAGAGVLVCSPCCHKELRPQMASPRSLAGVFRHGIHLGQEAEMVTDSLRALLLEASGYEAQVFEFVSLEHTSKNKMILATRRSGAGDAVRALGQVRDIKDFYGIREQCLETLLRRR